ncbi:hypothetical protein EW146_g2845 [Bondarzewia mesenterica]|uniref:Sec39 domain-containing protein n=1 Tax=Bondarzewia mesenterica TaxID=1095465 RepID=A0A4V3XFM1_9AGAM|nr:hypothetical protein EW146_g2845 [Bondarzewia mesenterica]
MASGSRDLCKQWTSIADHELTLDTIRSTLQPINDDLWVVAACVDRILDNVETQRELLELGLERSESALERGKNVFSVSSEVGVAVSPAAGAECETLVSYFQDEPADAKLCYVRSVLLGRLDRLNTFVEISKESVGQDDAEEEVDAEWEDDPWDETEDKGISASGKPPLPLSSFILDDLLHSACILATRQLFSAVRSLVVRHGSYLWPLRFTILDSIPEHTHPSYYRDILPGFNPSNDVEQCFEVTPWRTEADWSELTPVQQSLTSSGVIDIEIKFSYPPLSNVNRHPDPLPSTELTSWYRRRVDCVLSATGMTDVALALVQHGGSQGVPGLDELGEELSLLSRLVYDAPAADEDDMDEDWTLDRWRAMSPPAVVNAYLLRSTPESIVMDIRRLVMPYLFVLEARAERADQPDPSLSTRLLNDYILSAPLNMVAAIFEASKPTLPSAQRLIRNDEDLARVALACLYGSNSVDQWLMMSRIFECLPAWDADPNDGIEEDEVDTTVTSLGAFVTPSTTRPRCTPADLLVFFKPLPATSLSRALDILDVHLECGEILSRWSVPAPLRWFLQSAGDEAQQRAWATRMARRAGGSDDELDTQGDWEWLLEDMIKLSGTNDAGLKSAFGLLSRTEVIRIFFSGLLSTGKFEIAKALLGSRKNALLLDDEIIEDICLASSREFYDNASSGNYRFGDMKSAYDCLTVPAQSDKIIREREFIEATSRIASFNVTSRPGIPISPIEIRLTKDRLSLISRVLSSNSDAYKYTEVILDLVHKLGFRDDVTAEVKVLAMIADTALQAEDFARAYETSEAMVNTVLQMRSSVDNVGNSKVQEASEVCWVACFQLGRQPEFNDVQKKLSLLGRALEFCPADKLADVLASWRRLESEDIEERKERLAARRSGAKTNGDSVGGRQTKRSVPSASISPSSLASRFQSLHMPELHMPSPPLVSTPDAAALASTFNRVAASFPSFSVGGRPLSVASNESGRSGRADHADVSAQATRVFQKGIGWLIGADEEE